MQRTYARHHYSQGTGRGLPHKIIKSAKMVEYWKIDNDLIEHIALISRLTLTENENTLYTKQLGEVIASFRMLDELDKSLEGEQVAFHAINFENIWREDVPEKVRWNPLSNSLENEEGYFKGPRIL
jgi:aspartyl-tRNA(Asn)/glutamyl-tRNA(Gln) amidotransferase subunit C